MTANLKHQAAVKARSATVQRAKAHSEIPKMPEIEDEPTRWATYNGDTTEMGGNLFFAHPDDLFPSWGVLTTEYDHETNTTRVGFGRIS